METQEMLDAIEEIISKKYVEIKRQGCILTGTEDLYRQVRFHNPELALHIRKRLLDIAKNNGDLP